MRYLKDVPAHDLKVGDIIIVNQTYGRIYSFSPTHILTTAGKRLFSPDYAYPTFCPETLEEEALISLPYEA